ncbi:MAG: class I SAM-dependent methyltransferase [Mycobacteriales bacterium]
MGAAATPRYDGLADWYDETSAGWAEVNRADLLALLGAGDGRCLDLGCGTGQYFPILRASGRTVVGLDHSADQLRLARGRGAPVVRADATALPFRDGVFPLVAALWVSTDMDDFAGVVRAATRVLEPGGTLLFYGVHPCFNGPCVQNLEDGSRIVHPGYRLAGWHPDSPWWRPGGIRRRVGMRHVPLSDLFHCFLDAGLAIERVAEPRDDAIPHVLAVRARKPQR